jgi:type II secretory pathway component PulF
MVLQGQVENPVLARAIGRMRESVERGATLSAALARHLDVFDDGLVELARAAEAEESLPESLELFASGVDRSREIDRRVAGTLTQPFIIYVIAASVLSALLVLVIPQMREIYGSMNIELPLATQALFSISRLFERCWLLVCPGLLFAPFLLVRFLRSPAGTGLVDFCTPRVPLVGSMVSTVAVARLSRTLGSLLWAGVPSGRALALTSARLADLPPVMIELMSAGSESRFLGERFLRLADVYDTQVDRSMTVLTGVVEVVTIVGLGLAISSIVLAVFMPSVGLINNVG